METIFFQFETIINILVTSLPASFEYLCYVTGLGSTSLRVCRRQDLTSKVDTRTERVNTDIYMKYMAGEQCER